MGPLKSPSLDGFSAGFYQSYWHIVGQDVNEAILKFLNEDQMDKRINYTYIVLIPKIKTPDN